MSFLWRNVSSGLSSFRVNFFYLTGVPNERSKRENPKEGLR